MKPDVFENNITSINDVNASQSLIENNGTFSVKEFYRNKTIFITGVTGFVGKVLLEKFLRSLPDFKRIYVLIRSKNSQNASERFNQMWMKSLLFKSHQDKFEKIEAIDGDVSAENLGLSPEDRKKLIEEVDVVFHSAASIVFTGLFKNFIRQNIQGTESVMKLCKEMKHLKSVVHVSTAYANCHLKEIEEKVYHVIEDEDVDAYLDDLKRRYSEVNLEEGHPALAARPNPYTLSKSIAEWIIEQKYSSLPYIICRPSIVTNSDHEPFPGWCDTINGYSGLTVLMGIGIAQQVIGRMECKTDIIPVDYVVNSLMVCGAYRASSFYEQKRKVVHINTSTTNPITWQMMFDYSIILEHKFPSMKQVRPISTNIANPYQTNFDKLRYKFNQIFNHYLFAIIFDLICTILGYQPFMMKITRKMHNALNEVKYFSIREWYWYYENNLYIYGLLAKKEQPQFNCDVRSIEWDKYTQNMCLGCRRYLLKDPDSTFEQAKKRQYRLYLAFKFFAFIKYLFYHWLFNRIFSNTFLTEKCFSYQTSIIDLVLYIWLVGLIISILKIINKFNTLKS